MNYVIFRKFLSNRDCNFLLSMLNIPEEHKPLRLVDGEHSDKWYESKRNPGTSYIYSTNDSIRSMVRGIKKELTECTGIEWHDTISSEAAVFCKYGLGGVSNAHRDRDKTVNNLTDEGVTLFQEYTCIILLTENKDYDEFFINFDKSGVLVADDGKWAREVGKEGRFYPNLTKGDVIIFNNEISIHGVESVTSTNERITTAFRSK